MIRSAWRAVHGTLRRILRPLLPRTTGAAGEAGLATLALPLVLWSATLAAVVLIDLAAYLVAAARAQNLADAAVLAAVSDDVRGPRVAAARVVAAGEGFLEHCDCSPGRNRMTVEVSVTVPGLVISRVGATRVVARAHAERLEPATW